MLGFGWLTLRQAQAALKAGRLDEAQRLLEQTAARGHRRTGELLVQLARALCERGERQLQQDDTESAWRDLLRAEQLQTNERASERLRQALTRMGLAQVRALLQTGEVTRAHQLLGVLRDRMVRTTELQLLEEATRNWLNAQDLAERGEFAPAVQIVERLQRLLLGPSAPLEKFYQSLAQRQKDFARLLGRLHEASQEGRWREVVEVAELVLAAAPQHAEARRARARAWKGVEPLTVAHRPTDRPSAPPPPAVAALDGPPQRFCLWVDGVGGYLVCLGGRLSLGQATADTAVDVPLLADVSRLHATLSRDDEGGYLLEASRPVLVNSQPAVRAVLRDGDRITLGTSCQLQFRQAVPLSGSARLDVVSGHRLGLGVDGVLLMGDTIVLGATSQAHVAVPDLRHDLVLFRSKDALGVRHPGAFTVNGEQHSNRAVLCGNAVVSGDDFSLSVEGVSERAGRG